MRAKAERLEGRNHRTTAASLSSSPSIKKRYPPTLHRFIRRTIAMMETIPAAAPMSFSSLSSSTLRKEDVIKPSSWKGLTFADFDKTPTKKKPGGSKGPTGWMLLATAQQVDLGTSSSRKKKKTKKKSSSPSKKTQAKTMSSEDAGESRTTAKSPTKLSQRTLGGKRPLEKDIALYGDKPISTSELTATTVTMTASERSEEDLIFPVVTKLPMVEDYVLEAVVETEPLITTDPMRTAMASTPKMTTKTKTSSHSKTPSPDKKKKKSKTKIPSPEKPKKKSSSTTSSKKKVEKSPSTTAKSSKKKKSKKVVERSTAGDNDAATNAVSAIVEERLKEIEKLEVLLEQERRGLQSRKISMSCDQEIMRYVMQQEAERTDQIAQKIEGLQDRVVQMQQQELAMLHLDDKGRSKVQEHVLELQDLVQKQANEVQRLKKELRDVDQAGMVIDEKDLFDDMQTLVEENKELYEARKAIEQQYKEERLEWQRILDLKDETIKSLRQEVEYLKQASDLATSNTSTSTWENSNNGKTAPVVSDQFPTTPEAPKPAKKEKVSLQGMNLDAFKPPLEDII